MARNGESLKRNGVNGKEPIIPSVLKYDSSRYEKEIVSVFPDGKVPEDEQDNAHFIDSWLRKELEAGRMTTNTADQMWQRHIDELRTKVREAGQTPGMQQHDSEAPLKNTLDGVTNPPSGIERKPTPPLPRAGDALQEDIAALNLSKVQWDEAPASGEMTEPAHAPSAQDQEGIPEGEKREPEIASEKIETPPELKPELQYEEGEEAWLAKMKNEEPANPDERAWLNEVETFGTDIREEKVPVPMSEEERQRRQTAALLQPKPREARIEPEIGKAAVDTTDLLGRKEPTYDPTLGPSGERVSPEKEKDKLRSLLDKFANIPQAASEGFNRAKSLLSAQTEKLSGKLREMLHIKIPEGKVAERAEKLKKHLADRNAQLTEKTTSWSKRIGEQFLAWGDGYRKLDWKYKVGISAALLGLSVATAGTSTLVTLITSTGMFAQRALGAAGTYVALEQFLEQRLERKEQETGIARSKWQEWRKHGIAAGAGLALFSGVPGYYLKEGVEWLRDILPGSPDSIPSTDQSISRPQTPQPESTAAAPRSVIPTPDMPLTAGPIETASAPSGTILQEIQGIKPVEATPGKGYEWMTKRLWEQLQNSNLKAEDYQRDSDIRQLLEAKDEKTANDLIHRLAEEKKAFNKDGTSVLIKMEDKLTINPSTGKLEITGGIEGRDVTGDRIGTPGFEQAQGRSAAAESFIKKEGMENLKAQGVDPSQITLTEEQSTTESGTAEETSPVSERPTGSAVDRTLQFVNKHNVAINPLEGGVFSGPNDGAMAYGAAWEDRFEAAQNYAMKMKNPDLPVYVQSEVPYKGPDGVEREYVIEVRYKPSLFGIGKGSVQVVLPNGAPSPEQMGPIDPNTFTKRLDR